MTHSLSVVQVIRRRRNHEDYINESFNHDSFVPSFVVNEMTGEQDVDKMSGRSVGLTNRKV